MRREGKSIAQGEEKLRDASRIYHEETRLQSRSRSCSMRMRGRARARSERRGGVIAMGFGLPGFAGSGRGSVAGLPKGKRIHPEGQRNYWVPDIRRPSVAGGACVGGRGMRARQRRAGGAWRRLVGRGCWGLWYGGWAGRAGEGAGGGRRKPTCSCTCAGRGTHMPPQVYAGAIAPAPARGFPAA